MGWYRDETPPFENGKKKHEFPDAIALSQIIGFAQKDNSLVSFITSDKGIGRACENQTQISRYSTLPKFIDVILSDNSFAQQYKDELLGQGEQLVSSIKEFDDWFNLELEFSDDVSSIDARVRFDLSDVTVIGVGESECTFLCLV